MDSTWLLLLQRQVRMRRRVFEVPGCRQSRRVEGMFNRDDEVHGFKKLCIYVDAGLVGREKQVAEILGAVDGQIYGYEHHNHTRWLMFFGIEPDRFVTPGPSRVHSSIRACDWEGTLKKYISAEAQTSPLIIPKIVNCESARIRCPDHYDLGLIFCRTRDVFVKNEADLPRFRMIGPRCIWFFIGDDETPQMEAGIFLPKVITTSAIPLE